MARRRAVPKVTGGLRVQPAVDVSPADLWFASAWRTPKEAEEQHYSTKSSNHVTPTPCQCSRECYCGNVTADSSGECWFCRRGWHHVCGRTCHQFTSEVVLFGSVRVTTIPSRAACNGGRGFPRAPKPVF